MASPDVTIDATCLGRRKTGNESYIRGLLSGLDQLRPDFAIEVLTTPAHTGLRSAFFEWTEVPLGNFITRNFVALPAHMQRKGTRLFHATYWTRFWDQQPKILMIHDLSFVSFTKGYRWHERMVYKLLVRAAARNAAGILTVSEFSKREIVRHWQLLPDRVFVTPNATDDCFQPSPTPRQDAPAPGYILYVGNLHPRKNLVRLLDAYVLIRQHYRRSIRLRIVGQKAWLTQELFARVRNDALLNEVEFTGYIDQAALIGQYQNATVTVYPSLYEGFGMPVLEAMACGSPVVTSNSTSLPEVAGDAAVLVNPASSEAIADGINRVLESVKLQHLLRERGLARAQAFNWKRTADLTCQAYRAVGLD